MPNDAPLSTTISVHAAPTLESAIAEFNEEMKHQTAKDWVLHAISHACDPTGEPGKRWSIIAIFRPLGHGDLPVTIVNSENG